MGTTKDVAVPTSTLPNGLSVQHVSTQDLRFLYEEVFVQKCYLQHGLQLRPGDTVLDIGAHVCTCMSSGCANHAGSRNLNTVLISVASPMQRRIQHRHVCHGSG
jgi:hypothetical protein